jgi:hypothetical protein
MVSSPIKLLLDVLSSQKHINRKKKQKNYKMFVFAQDMEIRNWVKILLACTPLLPFTTARKTWEQASCNFLFKVHS